MTEWEQCLRQALGDVLETDAHLLTGAMTFSDLGLDSLTGLRFMRQVQDIAGVEIELEWMFDYPTTQRLAEFLNQRFGSLEARFASVQENVHAV
jgi:acyl carrier protein